MACLSGTTTSAAAIEASDDDNIDPVSLGKGEAAPWSGYLFTEGLADQNAQLLSDAHLLEDKNLKLLEANAALQAQERKNPGPFYLLSGVVIGVLVWEALRFISRGKDRMSDQNAMDGVKFPLP